METHHNSRESGNQRGSEYTSTHERALEFASTNFEITHLTLKVLSSKAEEMAVTASSDKLERTYVVSATESDSVKYLASDEADSAKDRLERKRNPTKSYKYFPTADKVQTRVIASNVGILKQPKWIDLRDILANQVHEIQFTNISFRELDFESILETGGTITFENEKEGFIVKEQSGKFYVYSQNQMVTSTFNDPTVGHDIDTLRTKLEELTESTFSITRFGNGNQEIRRNQLMSELASIEDGIWFLKDVIGSEGNQVIKIEIEDGIPVSALIASHMQKVIGDRTSDEGASLSPLDYIEHMFYPTAGYATPISSAILEKGIPAERIHGILAEPRALFAFNYDPYYLCSYSKVSADENLFPNLAQDGTAEAIRNSFTRILESKGLSGEPLSASVEETALRYKDEISSFATEFVNQAKEQGYSYGPLFAVDVALVWNNELRQIDFHLLEVQANPGTQGAFGNIPQDKIIKVNKYNKDINELDEEFL